MDMNSGAREIVRRWRTEKKHAERRIARFDERVRDRLEAISARSVLDSERLDDWQIRQAYYRGIDEYEFIDADWHTIKIGDSWGGKDVSAFFRREVSIPERMAGKQIALRIYIGGDSMLKVDGVPYHGLDPFRDTVILTDVVQASMTHVIELESFIHWYTSKDYHNLFKTAELVAFDKDIEAAYWDFAAAFKVLFVKNLDDSLKAFLETHLWDALLSIPVHEPDHDTFKSKLLEIQAQFRQAVYETDRFKTSGMLHLVGHSHLDIVYQWPYREYVRKVGRTHATMLRLMDQYPDFRFTQSSAKIYADMKDHHPEIYAQVKQRIAEGRWQPVGAFWVEPDCNLISGESFVRHIMHGQRFWHEEFGFQSRVCWEPDVFGMTWTLPQIFKRSGIDVVMCNKLTVWNDTNRWTQNTFWWEGPDGTRILTVFPPGHFIGMVDPDHMNQYWHDFSDKEAVGEMIYTYGWGDGGGGVDPEMLESATRYHDFPGVVPTKFAHPEETLLRIAEKADGATLPIWSDELYLEAHRGTFTSKGLLKKRNRQCERLYRQAEVLASLAWQAGQSYPTDQLDAGWKTLLNTQFHDALPGTHITEVYRYLQDEYATAIDIANGVQASATNALLGENLGDHVVIFNSLLTSLDGVVELPSELLQGRDLQDSSDNMLVQQAATKLDGTEIVLVQLVDPIPSVGYAVYALTSESVVGTDSELSAKGNTLENHYLRVEFADNGEIISCWDKEAGREVMAANERGNCFQLYEDRPGNYDAWDIVSTYVEHELPMNWACSLQIDEDGPLRASLRLVRQCYDSVITQRISLRAGSRELTFETEVDWKERQRLLKVGFPLSVNTRQATYDIAYGNMQRPTHRNTSFDAARFEVPAHWWMDMSEGRYGVALLNDSKYGHEANGHWMRLTLLKGSISPDPVADLETHYFTYVLLPHTGDWRDGGVNQAATRLNTTLYTRNTDQAPTQHSYVSCDATNVTMEALKRSEDGDYLILRLLERHNALTTTRLSFSFDVESAHVCDLMENLEQAVPVDGNTIALTIKPYEIVTLALKVH